MQKILSDRLTEGYKSSFTDMVVNGVNTFLLNATPPIFLPFSPLQGELDYNYYVVDGLSKEKEADAKYKNLDKLIETLLADFSRNEILFCILRGKLISSVRFYLAHGVESLEEALEYKDVVSDDHKIFLEGSSDVFKFTSDGKIQYEGNRF